MRGVIISKSYVVAAQQGFANGRQKGLTDSSDVIDQLLVQLQAARAALVEARAALAEAQSKLEMLNAFCEYTRTETDKMH